MANIFKYYSDIVDGKLELDNGERVSIPKQLDEGGLLFFNPIYLKYSRQKIQSEIIKWGHLEKVFDDFASPMTTKAYEYYFGTLALFEENVFEDKKWILHPIEILEKLEEEKRTKILAQAYIKLSKESDFQNLKEITSDQYFPLLATWEFTKVFRDEMKKEDLSNVGPHV